MSVHRRLPTPLTANPAPAHLPLLRALVFLFLPQLFAAPLYAQPVLECSVEAPVIIGDNANVHYSPMPFPLTLTVHNRGTALAHPITATIVFDADLALAGDDAPDRYSKTLDPPGLFPTQIGKAQWMLRHPPSTIERSYKVRVFVHAPGADTASCETTVIIPPFESPVLAPRCYVPDSLHFDEGTDSYVPNPFTVRLTCVNNGNGPADEVTGTLILPPNVELVDPQDSLTKRFNPPTLPKWRIGDPVPELTWQVRWVPRLRADIWPEFRFLATGTYNDSLRIDSVEVRCLTRIPGLQPLFNGCMRIPDSLGLREDGTDVTPNPFTVRYPLRNISHIAGRLSRVYISYPPDGLSLNPASPWPINSILDELVEPGDSMVFEWQIDVANRITRRRVLIQVTVIDGEGNPMVCEDWLPIANLRTALSDSCGSSTRVLRFIPSQDDYDPRRFVISSKLRNDGGANVHDVIAELEWEDASGQDLIEFDPDFAGDNTNPKVRDFLFPGQTSVSEWGFRLRNRNTTGVTQYMAFNIKYGSRETPYIANGCEIVVEIEPIPPTAITGPSSISDFVLLPNHPNPFHGSTTIEFDIAQAAPVTLTVTDALGREVRRLREGTLLPPGRHSIRFNAHGLPPGMYHCALSDGRRTARRSMVLLQ